MTVCSYPWMGQTYPTMPSSRIQQQGGKDRATSPGIRPASSALATHAAPTPDQKISEEKYTVTNSSTRVTGLEDKAHQKE